MFLRIAPTRLAAVIAVVAFLSSSMGMPAQLPSRVFGTVVDEGAVVGAKVSLLNGEGAAERTTETDSSGNFSMPDVGVGKYTVRIEQKNFEMSEISVDAGPDLPLEPVRITLHLAAVRETVSVTANLGDRLTGYSATDADVSSSQNGEHSRRFRIARNGPGCYTRGN